MTGRQQLSDVVASRSQDHGRVAHLHDVAVVVRMDDMPSSVSATSDLKNVVPFARAHRPGAEPSVAPLKIGLEERPTPPPPKASADVHLALVACSLVAHGALLATFWQEPRALASVGIEVITIEIVLGTNTAAGLATTPGENEIQSAASVEDAKSDEPVVDQEQQRATEAPQEVPVAEREVAPEAKSEERPQDQQPEMQQPLAMVETPRAEQPTAPPRETPPDMTVVIPPAPEQPRKQQPVAEMPKSKLPARKQQPTPERTRIAARTVEQSKQEARSQPSVPANAASGIGRGRSDNDMNYRGIVAAHLARHKQYPAAARSSGAAGTGTVSFTLDGSGRVTSASVVRATGIAILDQELGAMTRRASPFPAPPGGRSMRFTVPVSFRLN